jgi:uncharacterized membrane protein
MKAIASIRNKIKKPSRSTVLFWVGSFVAVLGAVLPLIIPGAQLVLSIIGVGGVVLAGSQKIVGDREQDQKFEQERKAREAAVQKLSEQTEEAKIARARARILNSVPKDSHQQTTP